MAGDGTGKGGILVGAVLVLGLLGMGAAIFWRSHEMTASGYEEGSICARALDRKIGGFTALLAISPTTDKPEDTTKQAAEQISKNMNADRDDFVEIVERIRFAERKKFMKDGFICLPADAEFSLAAFPDYAADLAKRLKRDPEACRVQFDDDVIAYLKPRFQCRAAAP